VSFVQLLSALRLVLFPVFDFLSRRKKVSQPRAFHCAVRTLSLSL
jgi:hypothetical protein